MRTVKRPRRYVERHWLTLMSVVLRYSVSRDAYVLRAVGARLGPVLRVDRRVDTVAPRRFSGAERRRASAA